MNRSVTKALQKRLHDEHKLTAVHKPAVWIVPPIIQVGRTHYINLHQ